MVIGKSPEEVLSLLGKPNSTREYEGWFIWTYENCTFDPVANRIDVLTTIEFRKGKAVSIDAI